MLDIKKIQSTNTVTIIGTLNELNIEEKTTADGRAYVHGTANVKVDQEINGTMVENIIPVRMFSMRLKKDKTPNAVYDGIVRMKETFTSAAAAESPEQVSRVAITSGQLQENIWIDKTTNNPRSSFQISSNFINKANRDEVEKATFELSGVIGDMKDELDKDGEETGRLIIKFLVVVYLGKVDMIELIAEKPEAVNHIKNNWEKGDTVTLAGIVNMTYEVKTWMEEQGFGAPIERRKTVSKKELIITSGSPSGLDEDYSYDNDAIKIALEERAGRIEKLKNDAKAKTTTSSAKSFDVGF